MKDRKIEKIMCRHCGEEIDTTKEYAVVLANCVFINSDRQVELEGTYYHAECIDEIKGENIESEEE